MYLCACFFFSSRRRHTRCAFVTGVQTCALPICEATLEQLSALLAMEAVPGLLRAASFRRRMVSSCSGLRITDPPAAWAARLLGLPALPVPRRRDGEGAREATAGSCEPRPCARRFSTRPVLGGLKGRWYWVWAVRTEGGRE